MPDPTLPDEQRLALQLLQRDLLSAVPRVGSPDHHDHVVRHQLLVLDAADGEAGADDSQLCASLRDPVDRGLTVADQERDRDIRVLFLEASDESREHVLTWDRARTISSSPLIRPWKLSMAWRASRESASIR